MIEFRVLLGNLFPNPSHNEQESLTCDDRLLCLAVVWPEKKKYDVGAKDEQSKY